MRWIDCAGAPGVGKSAILDEGWPRRVAWDGRDYPGEWSEFIERTAGLVRRAKGAEECGGIVEATFRKIATVDRAGSSGVYVQTGLAQIGLELGWRLSDPEEVAAYYEVMPISLGVAFLFADVETVQARNRTRSRDFSNRVPAMEIAREVGERVLASRRVRLLKLDTRLPVEENRAILHEFARQS